MEGVSVVDKKTMSTRTIVSFHNNTRTDKHAPANGLGIEAQTLSESHCFLLAGGSLRILLELRHRASLMDVLAAIEGESFICPTVLLCRHGLSGVVRPKANQLLLVKYIFGCLDGSESGGPVRTWGVVVFRCGGLQVQHGVGRSRALGGPRIVCMRACRQNVRARTAA